jgi:hypothetical protein
MGGPGSGRKKGSGGGGRGLSTINKASKYTGIPKKNMSEGFKKYLKSSEGKKFYKGKK